MSEQDAAIVATLRRRQKARQELARKEEELATYQRALNHAGAESYTIRYDRLKDRLNSYWPSVEEMKEAFREVGELKAEVEAADRISRSWTLGC